jgi:hypothetical protein
MKAFWEKIPIVEKHLPNSKKNMVLNCEIVEGSKYIKIYGGEDSTANFTAYD